MTYLAISMIDPPKLLGRFKDQMAAMPIFEGMWQETVEIESCSKSGDKVVGKGSDGINRVIGIFVEDTKCLSM